VKKSKSRRQQQFTTTWRGRLKDSAVILDELRELLARLLNYGILRREENNTERVLYNRFLRIEQAVRKLLNLFGINLQA
jgi:hypothetical protein